MESQCLSLIFYNLKLDFKENLKKKKQYLENKTGKMGLRNRNFSTAFCSHFFTLFHILFTCFSHFQNALFYIFFQAHFQNAFFCMFCGKKMRFENALGKNVKKMRFENALGKKREKRM